MRNDIADAYVAMRAMADDMGPDAGFFRSFR